MRLLQLCINILAIALLQVIWISLQSREGLWVLEIEREGDQLPVNILLVSFQDIVAVDVCFKEKKRLKVQGTASVQSVRIT
jgi:hypothetical protein